MVDKQELHQQFLLTRRLLARLRDLMAAANTAPQDLPDAVVELIAEHFHADVCSLYILRPGDILELFATRGLHESAVHVTRLHVGQGIIGQIARRRRPMAIADVRQHPDFVFRPETREDIYQSLLGVPLIRDGRLCGVLAIQYQQKYHYQPHQIELLQTTAMLVAELITRREVVHAEEMPARTSPALLSHHLQGQPTQSGMGLGTAFIHNRGLSITQLVSDKPEYERARLHEALLQLRQDLDHLLANLDEDHGKSSRDIFETYRMFAADRGWIKRMEAAIDTGLSAQGAVQKVLNNLTLRLHNLPDQLWRARAVDLEDLANRLIGVLQGKNHLIDLDHLPDEMVLIARHIGAAELLEYGVTRLKALVLEQGTPHDHAVIIARSIGLPVVYRCVDILAMVDPAMLVAVDGENGRVILEPSEDVIAAISAHQITHHRILHQMQTSPQPATTKDGQKITLATNAGLPDDVDHMHAVGASGIGLYRTEILFMVRSEYPDFAQEVDLYCDILQRARGKAVVFRLLDIGYDKPLPYFHLPDEPNPALGWRAVRIGLDRPALLLRQLRALMQAAGSVQPDKPLQIMAPFVTDLGEVVQLKSLLYRAKKQLLTKNIPVPSQLCFGIMIEVPAVIWQLPEIFSHIDFATIGTNDLWQYVSAFDRSYAPVAQRYDPLCLSFLRILRQILQQAKVAKIPLSLCGEIAGRRIDFLALLGLGFTNLSMNASQIMTIGEVARKVDLLALQALIDNLLARSCTDIRSILTSYAHDHHWL